MKVYLNGRLFIPQNPPSFCDEGTYEQNGKARGDVISLYTKSFEKGVFIKGQIKATITISSDQLDTSFFVSVYIKKPDGDFRLRHDITSLSFAHKTYTQTIKVLIICRPTQKQQQTAFILINHT